jgi:transcriptional regulator with XRE-family HTH domain
MAIDKKIYRSKSILAKNLERIRQEQNHSLNDLSLKSQLKKETLEKIINGKGNPTLKDITKLAIALEVPVNQLVSENLEIKE